MFHRIQKAQELAMIEVVLKVTGGTSYVPQNTKGTRVSND